MNIGASLIKQVIEFDSISLIILLFYYTTINFYKILFYKNFEFKI